jgi:hypothetical protein
LFIILALDNQERDELYTLRDENTKLHDLLVQLKDELQKIKDSKMVSPSPAPPYVNVEVGKENVSVVNAQQVAAPAISMDSNDSGHQETETSHQRSAFHNEQLRELQQKMILAHQELSRAKEALLGQYHLTFITTYYMLNKMKIRPI